MSVQNSLSPLKVNVKIIAKNVRRILRPGFTREIPASRVNGKIKTTSGSEFVTDAHAWQ